MQNYLMIYRGGGMPSSEEEGEAEMAQWMEWMGKYEKDLVDPGNPVGQSHSVRKDGASEGAVEPAMGYTILRAASLEDAIAAAQSSPHHNYGGFVEVAEIIPIEM